MALVTVTINIVLTPFGVKRDHYEFSTPSNNF